MNHELRMSNRKSAPFPLRRGDGRLHHSIFEILRFEILLFKVLRFFIPGFVAKKITFRN